MLAPSRLAHPFARWLVSIGAIVAIVAQLSVALAPLGEARLGGGTASHLESGGTSAHYAHNDATCAVCQARLLQGLATRTPDVLLTGTVRATTTLAADERFITLELFSPSNPRAPPSGL